MLKSLIKLAQFVMLHARKIVVVSEFFLRFLLIGIFFNFLIFFDSNSNREIEKGSLEVTHVVITLTTHVECPGHCSIFITCRTQRSESFLKLLLIFITLLGRSKTLFVDLSEQFFSIVEILLSLLRECIVILLRLLDSSCGFFRLLIFAHIILSL